MPRILNRNGSLPIAMFQLTLVYVESTGLLQLFKCCIALVLIYVYKTFYSVLFCLWFFLPETDRRTCRGRKGPPPPAFLQTRRSTVSQRHLNMLKETSSQTGSCKHLQLGLNLGCAADLCSADSAVDKQGSKEPTCRTTTSWRLFPQLDTTVDRY